MQEPSHPIWRVFRVKIRYAFKALITFELKLLSKSLKQIVLFFDKLLSKRTDYTHISCKRCIACKHYLEILITCEYTLLLNLHYLQAQITCEFALVANTYYF